MAAIIEPNDLMYRNYEPRLKNRFMMVVDGLESWYIRSSGLPKVNSNVITIPHINVERKVKGKSTWDAINITLLEPIVQSAAQDVMEWFRLSHESQTGRDGYLDAYQKDISLLQLDPTGTVIGTYVLIDSWPSNLDFGDHDWGADDVMETQVTIQYNYALQEF